MLTGCGETPVAKAQNDIDFLHRHGGTDDQMCDAQTKLADAYREAHDKKNYDLQALIARNACKAAELRHWLGL